MKKVEFFKHNLSSRDIANLEKAARGLFLSTGDLVTQFEKNFAKYMDAKYALGVTSCTAALHLALLALDIGPGDEVITTPLSFIATSNAIEYVGARPVFIDVEPKTGNMNAAKIEAAITKRTRAILPVHLYGQMCDMKTIAAIARKHKLSVIEDAAHAIESTRDGIQPGKLSDAACFSFYATKNLTSGEGGALTTNNKKLAERVRMLRQHGMSTTAADRYTKKYRHYDMLELGFKYNMYNLQAALLIDQLARLNVNLKKRAALVARYEKAFAKNPKITRITQLSETIAKTRSAHHLYTILVPKSRRDTVMHKLQDKNIGVAVNFRPIHKMSYYKNKYGTQSFPIAEDIGAHTISLPLYPRLTAAEQSYVIACVNEAV
ncbi:UDP-4-amino-4,6-dideoxy-N-acetyl-beta-L-altrosamine transaminase [Candidatus Peregrinibacteria bacterium CG11_big_fil_rev_8_21_14_0_20_46_8]|nr:MAG: UDP-4-amino-4,6-dideoxy-N-acetyl-beta-L-altrosamine transaminase [Candidatus Peregrinibacteria bacterium CG11_big_fil_rev_8_21_14_0_20_46_8]